MWITLGLLTALLLADQVTKYLAELLIEKNHIVNLIPHVLDSTLAYNTGAAWSMFSDATWLLAILSLVASAVLVYFITKNNWQRKKMYSTAITLMLAGTFGNCIDRIFACFNLREGVVDMIILKPLDYLWEAITKSGFPIFNVADMCLVIGIICLAMDIIFFSRKASKTMKYIVEKEYTGVRLDKALAGIIEGKSRSYALKCIEEGKVLVNQKVEKPSYVLKLGDEICYETLEEKALDVEAKNLHLEIVYEDADIAIVNKPKGMVVHPGAGNMEDTLVHGLLYELEDLSTINGVIRPGIVHRIDKDTTGLLMIAKNDMAAMGLAEQLKQHTCKRRYIALVYGSFVEDKGKINAPIGRDPMDRKKMAVVKLGKSAITHFKVLKRYTGFTLVECELETGRTHQIRVHMSYIDHPVVGDKVYGRRKVIGDQGQFLHAKCIGFYHPRTKNWLEFEVDLPKYFQDFLTTLEN